MFTFNNKLILPNKLQPSECVFDASYAEMVFRNKDFRDTPRISYTLNGENHRGYYNTKIKYDLPEIDKIYTLTFTGTPRKNNYIGFSGSIDIYKNHEQCQDFIYGSKQSQTIIGYRGERNNIYIPKKYNLLPTTSVTITSFPNVVGDISITINETLHSFNIKDLKIREMTIQSPIFSPVEGQFKGMINLETIVKNSTWSVIPDECFYSCSKFSPSDDFFKNTVRFGTNSLYGTTFKSLRFAGDTINGSGLTNCNVFTKSTTLDGYNEKSAYTQNETDSVKRFVGLNDGDWTGKESPSDAAVIPMGINKERYGVVEMFGVPVPLNCVLLECTDPNIIGFKYRLLSDFSDEADIIGYAAHIPTGNTNTYQEDYFTIVDNKKFFLINKDYFYNDNDEDRLMDDEDILEISAFDKNGYKSTVIRKRIDGVSKPTYRTHIAFYTTEDNSTLMLNEKVFESNVPAGRLYIYGDLYNIPSFVLAISDESHDVFWDKLVYTKDMNRTSIPDISWVDVSDYANIDAILNQGIFSWIYDELEDFNLWVFNADENGNTMTGNPAGSYSTHGTLADAKLTFNSSNITVPENPESPGEPDNPDNPSMEDYSIELLAYTSTAEENNYASTPSVYLSDTIGDYIDSYYRAIYLKHNPNYDLEILEASYDLINSASIIDSNLTNSRTNDMGEFGFENTFEYSLPSAIDTWYYEGAYVKLVLQYKDHPEFGTYTIEATQDFNLYD